MKKTKGFLQKTATVSGTLSFIAALVCGGYLYLNFDTLGAYSPITASLEATIFFFICVGVVLLIIGRSNLPSFKIE